MVDKKNIYLLYGEEKFDINQKVEKIKKEFNNLEVGVNLFYINNDNLDSLDNICQSVTFFGDSKLVIIKDTNLKFDIEILKNIDEQTVVIIIEDSVDKRTSNYKSLTKIAECIEYKSLDKRQMSTYIVQTLSKYNIQVSSVVADYMVEVCGIDKTNNINEMQKLVIYMGSQGIITKEIIDKVCSKTLNAKIFDVLDKIINKDRKNAIELLDNILKQKESIVKIYIMLYKQVKQMYMIKYLKVKKYNDIAKYLGIHPFVFKNLNSACDKYTLDELKNIIYEFDRYDEKTKAGEMDFEVGLKKIICMM